MSRVPRCIGAIGAWGRRRGSLLLCVLAFASIASVAVAQRRFGAPIRWATPADYDGAFLFCRVAFRQSPYGDGGGWNADYPRADMNLPFRFSELTKAPVSRDPDGQMRHVVIRLTDTDLSRCPFIMMTEVGRAFFDEAEATALREYLLRGGFLWVDDFWGTRAWEAWSGEIGKALQASQYPPVDLPLSHELFHVLYDVRRVPQIPNIGFWLGTGGGTSERGFDSQEPHARGIFDERGRMMVLMTHNTDFGDSFEREGDNHQYFLAFAPEGYAVGVNTLLYAMTH